MQTPPSSSELATLWSQVVGLATRVGEVREQNKFHYILIQANTSRITALERERLTQPTGMPLQDTEPTPSLAQRLFRLEELIKVVVAIYKIWRAAPWGLLLFGIVAGVRWAWPPVSRFFGLQ